MPASEHATVRLRTVQPQAGRKSGEAGGVVLVGPQIPTSGVGEMGLELKPVPSNKANAAASPQCRGSNTTARWAPACGEVVPSQAPQAKFGRTALAVCTWRGVGPTRISVTPRLPGATDRRHNVCPPQLTEILVTVTMLPIKSKSG
jgi:hypothetical protein